VTGSGAAAAATVLVVEDDEAIRMLARLGLEADGYVVLAASGGERALELARVHAGPIHLLITDIQLPGMRGPDLAARIVALRPEIKVLFMSGYLDRALAGQEGLGPAAALLGKPFSIETLARKARELLES